MRFEYPSLRQGLIRAWCPSLGASGSLLIDRGQTAAHASWSGTGFRYSPFGVTLTAATTFAISALPASLDFDTTSRFSFSARINFTAGAERTLAFIGPFEFLVGADNTFRVAFGSVFSTNFLRAATPALTAGTDLHVVAVYTGTKTASGVLFWVNGDAVATTSQINTLTANTVSASGTRFFNRSTNTNQWLGSADDFRFYNRALTPAEIRLLASRRGIGLQPLQDRAAGLPRKLSVNVGGTWRPADAYVHDGTAFRLSEAKINVSGVWK